MSRLTSPSMFMFDRVRERNCTLYMASSGRSGSTWLAELMTTSRDTRFTIDPTDVQNRNFRLGLEFGAYVDPAERDERLEFFYDRLLSGSFRSSFTDQRNRARVPVRRFIRDNHTTSLLPWIVTRYPDVPVIYLLRHPFAVAWSWTELGWKGDPIARMVRSSSFSKNYADYETPLVQQAFLYNVTIWCAENCLAIQKLSPGSVFPIFYEPLVKNPEAELEALRGYLEQSSGAWNTWKPDLEAVKKPSWMNLRRAPAESPSEWIHTWHHRVDRTTLEVAHGLLHSFGLDRVYGMEPYPLIRRDELLPGRASA